MLLEHFFASTITNISLLYVITNLDRSHRQVAIFIHCDLLMIVIEINNNMRNLYLLILKEKSVFKHQ